MTTSTTQIILPSNISCESVGHFNFHNLLSSINISGSNCSGKYLYNTINKKTLILNGSGGGNLLGLPPVILINMTGQCYIHLTENKLHMIFFTALIQITVCGNTGTVSINQCYACITCDNEITPTPDIKVTLELSDNVCVSVIYANNTRYLNLGCFKIKFTIIND